MAAVAELAGVSTGTVSNVLNYPERVSELTTKRVLDAMDQIGFVRNSQAAALVSGRSNMVGLVLADLRNTLFTDMSDGAQDVSDELGLKLVIANSLADTKRQNDYITFFQETHAGGFLLAPMSGALEGFKRAHSRGIPVVLLNHRIDDISCCAVLTNNEKHGFLAASHLIAQGYTRLAYVAHSFEFQPVTDRWRGVERAVAAHPGTTLGRLDPGGHLYDDGLELGRRLASDAGRPDGLVAVTDALGNGLIEGLMEAGAVGVPRDVGVVGCEGDRSAERGRVRLTTVDHPGFEMGRQAMAQLSDEIANPAAHVHRTLMLDPTLRVRESSLRRAEASKL